MIIRLEVIYEDIRLSEYADIVACAFRSVEDLHVGIRILVRILQIEHD
jgi:hypothetical protein